jgi:hypothetical protein
MTRGIHLRRLRPADLKAIGVPDAGLPAAADDERERPLRLPVQADPVLSRALKEVRQGLETTLRHLDEALSTSSSTRLQPPET